MNNMLIFETQYWEVLLTKDQKYFGRSLVLLKRECGSLSELTNEEGTDFFKVVKKVENIFREKFNATMFNWTCLMNDAYKKDLPTPQIHWHVRPRYREPVEFDGKTFSDPNFAHHYLRGEENVDEIPEKMLSKILEVLKRNSSSN